MKFSFQENIALAPLTTLKVGGAARFFVEAKTEQNISEAVIFAEENKLPLFVLGGGSNILISDEGFNGLVLKISLKGIIEFKSDSETHLRVQAGEDWDGFVKFCVEKNLQGVECLTGIPGTVGGTPVQNVGAYGQEVSETIVSVKVLERESGKIFEMTNEQCHFTYRSSIFNTTHKNQYVVLAVTFCLKSNGEPKIVYKDLQQAFSETKPNLAEVRQAVLQIRAAKSMVVDENDTNSKSAGSFFKNPVISVKKLEDIERVAKQQGIENVPKFPVDVENVKIPAAWLIENAGFQKGFKFGKAGISSKHALAIINLGDAAAADILNLKTEIQNKVREKFGIELKPEPVFVGFENS